MWKQLKPKIDAWTDQIKLIFEKNLKFQSFVFQCHGNSEEIIFVFAFDDKEEFKCL